MLKIRTLAVAACAALSPLVTRAAVAEVKLTAAEAHAFLTDAEQELLELGIEAERANWVNATFITDDTDALAARAGERLAVAWARYAKASRRFDGVALSSEDARKLEKLRLGLVAPAPEDPKESEELSLLLTRLQSTYGKGKYTPSGSTATTEPLDLTALSNILAESRDAEKLLDAWKGWRTVSPPMRADYARFVTLSNKASREMGFTDTGAMWRAKYDMPADDFAKECDRLWEQVKPLYLKLHAYTRMKLRETYGKAAVPADGPIPAHLLGNMWAQSWENVYPLLAPKGVDPGYDLNAILKEKKLDARAMVKVGEGFFTSLGFAPLPQTFWERSLFVKPKDREVVCHASAWNLDQVDDLRIKMCIQVNAEDFVTIHHELGHNFYQRAGNKLPPFFRDGANDGFHEAIGDAIALSITPSYLKKLGFIEKEPDASKDTGLLLNQALQKVSFLPFGLLIDKWRWGVFSGQIPESRYNAAWWDLVRSYQGVAAPVARSEKDFDPGAKYHVPANTPYMRYFLAHILQFQFHRALAKEAGCTQPLHRCSVYGSKAAGAKFAKMLEMGASKPWPDALEALTGQRQMDATAILDYFAPLSAWLDKELAKEPVGWK